METNANKLYAACRFMLSPTGGKAYKPLTDWTTEKWVAEAWMIEVRKDYPADWAIVLGEKNS